MSSMRRINMNDLYLIQGVYPVRPSLPSVGNEGVGRVLAIGRGVDHLWWARQAHPPSGFRRFESKAAHVLKPSTDPAGSKLPTPALFREPDGHVDGIRE